ncbi:MAG TPA: acylphosphatase [Mariprofundaceae bacterium]|nr:acylphosphatase [Mariprofundaceae bacterium]
MSESCRRIRIYGRVQGVFFRHHTKQQAKHLGISGWVRNLPDGSVEAVICGSTEQLDRMESWLAEGPEGANVEKMESRIDQLGDWSGFEIRS